MHFRVHRSSSFRSVTVPALVAVGAFLIAAEASAQVSLDVLQRSGYGMVRFDQPNPNMLRVRAKVNGRPANLVIDTGASGEGIILDSGFANQLRLSARGEGKLVSATGKAIGVRQTTAKTVALGNANILNVPLTIGGFKGVRTSGIDGVLSAGFLRRCSAVIDFHNRRLYVRPPGSGRRVLLGPALKGVGLAEVPFGLTESGGCLIDVEINGAAGLMILDTGATFGGVDRRFASAMKAKAYDSETKMMDAAGETRWADLTNPRSFKVGGVPLRITHLVISDYAFYSASRGKVIGLLGVDVLGPNWAIIDFGQKKLYLAAAKQ
jgi:predicted aspartyl protease